MSSKTPALKTPSKIHRLPVTQARNHLGELVRRVDLNGEYFIFEKDGVPIAGLMNIEEFEDYLEMRDPKVQAQIQKSHRAYVAGKSRPAEILLATVREPSTSRSSKTSLPAKASIA